MAGDKVFRYKVVVSVVDDRSLSKLESSIKKIGEGVKLLSKRQKEAAEGFSKLSLIGGDGFEKLIEKVKKLGFQLLVIKGITASIGAAFDFGKKVIDAGKFRQTAVLGLEQSFKGRGEGIFQDLIKVANKTPADTKPLLEFANTLTPALKGNEETLKKLTLLRADFEARGAPTSVLDSLSSVLLTSLGGAKPETTADAIQKIGGATLYNKFLGKELGITENNPAILAKKINDAKKEGKITAQAYTQAYVNFANEYLGQSKIGESSVKFAQGSLAGALSNFSSVLDNLLFSIKLEDQPGIKAFVKVLNNLSEIITGPEFQKGIELIINQLFGGFENLAKNPERIRQGMLALLATVKEIATWFGKIFDWITKIATASSASEALLDVVNGIKEVFIYIGELIGAGIKAAFFGKEIGPALPLKPGERPADTHLLGNTKLSEADTTSFANGLGLKIRPDITKSGQEYTTDNPIVISNNIVVNGDANPEQVAKAAESGTASGIDKAQKKKQLRKAGKDS